MQLLYKLVCHLELAFGGAINTRGTEHLQFENALRCCGPALWLDCMLAAILLQIVTVSQEEL